MEFKLSLHTATILPDEFTATGTIQIGDFSERFEADLSYWTVNQYKASWCKAAALLVAGNDKAAFITSITDPVTANFIFWWIAYRSRARIYLQQQVLFMQELHQPFDPHTPSLYIAPRSKVDEEGNKISEWEISMDDIRGFRDTYCL